jgi:PleD family two-component response regulator
MTTLEKRISQLEESQAKVNARTLSDVERAVRISRMLATRAPGWERIWELLERAQKAHHCH